MDGTGSKRTSEGTGAQRKVARRIGSEMTSGARRMVHASDSDDDDAAAPTHAAIDDDDVSVELL